MTLAWNVLREHLRNRVLYLLAGLGLALMLVMLTGGEGSKVTDASGANLLESVAGAMRVGIAMVGLFAALVTVVLSMSTIPREFERQTIHLLLVRPVTRWQLALSFLLGNLLSCWLFLLVIALPLFPALGVRGAASQMGLVLAALPALALNVAMVAAATTLLSTRLPGPAAGFLGLLLYGLGAFGESLSGLAAMSKSAWAPLFRVGVSLLPPIEALSGEAARLFAATAAGPDLRVYVGALLWLWAVAGLTALSFSRREAV